LNHIITSRKGNEDIAFQLIIYIPNTKIKETKDTQFNTIIDMPTPGIYSSSLGGEDISDLDDLLISIIV
jgi:hypothetical protein